MRRERDPSVIDLKGITPAPSQIWRSVRLVPLIRESIRENLRLYIKRYADGPSMVNLGGREAAPKAFYSAYIPHGFIVDWSEDGMVHAAFGTRLMKNDAAYKQQLGVKLFHRMVKRTGKHQLRMLPLHVAMEGFLSLQFGGPDIAWNEYSREGLSRGLSHRYEKVLWGHRLQELDGAFRIFEIHENQVGVLLFIGETLASAFVTPHPDDYRALHRTLIEDFYGPDLVYAARMGNAVSIDIGFDDEGVETIADLRAALLQMKQQWTDFQVDLAGGLLHRPIVRKKINRVGPCQLYRFTTDLNRSRENHIGEMIVSADGTIEYLKTYRLSAAQTRRAYLLGILAEHHWNIEATAAACNQSRDAFILRMENAGFGYILKKHVIEEARRRRR